MLLCVASIRHIIIAKPYESYREMKQQWNWFLQHLLASYDVMVIWCVNIRFNAVPRDRERKRETAYPKYFVSWRNSFHSIVWANFSSISYIHCPPLSTRSFWWTETLLICCSLLFSGRSLKKFCCKTTTHH